MNNKIGLYFQLEVNDPKDSLSMVKLALNRLEQLTDEGVDVQYFELRLKERKELEGTKQAYIKLDGNERTFIDNESSFRWDEAFMNAFDRIHDQLRLQNNYVPETVHYA